ncbi:hypothetical protein M011DRAFT_92068 [Sporormia fimetaria CBS 119925]|uniref:Uncharacterized protein n=1 Tax=Sporormia fimetaria CBS 119925 TaxID=1340428 RepID=A0A6A6V6K0_9PLEO|nr:hypothetical protein M011DRAFT_92068 [Sporormia fimetaria CBS 119925]
MSTLRSTAPRKPPLMFKRLSSVALNRAAARVAYPRPPPTYLNTPRLTFRAYNNTLRHVSAPKQKCPQCGSRILENVNSNFNDLLFGSIVLTVLLVVTETIFPIPNPPKAQQKIKELEAEVKTLKEKATSAPTFKQGRLLLPLTGKESMRSYTSIEAGVQYA